MTEPGKFDLARHLCFPCDTPFSSSRRGDLSHQLTRQDTCYKTPSIACGSASTLSINMRDALPPLTKAIIQRLFIALLLL
jgi:hypothetical protein